MPNAGRVDPLHQAYADVAVALRHDRNGFAAQ